MQLPITTNPRFKWALWATGGLLLAAGAGTALWYFLWRSPNPEKPRVGHAPPGTASGSNDLPPNGSNHSLEPMAEEALDPRYAVQVIQQQGQVQQLASYQATAYAQTIREAFGSRWTPDDEEAVFAVFEALPDKVAVSQVAAAYERPNIANYPLLDDLQRRLSDEEWETVMTIIDPLPSHS